MVHVGHSVLLERLKVLTGNLKTSWSVFQSNNLSIAIRSAKDATEESWTMLSLMLKLMHY